MPRIRAIVPEGCIGTRQHLSFRQATDPKVVAGGAVVIIRKRPAPSLRQRFRSLVSQSSAGADTAYRGRCLLLVIATHGEEAGLPNDFDHIVHEHSSDQGIAARSCFILDT
jgi:hypothetical protein